MMITVNLRANTFQRCYEVNIK